MEGLTVKRQWLAFEEIHNHKNYTFFYGTESQKEMRFIHGWEEKGNWIKSKEESHKVARSHCRSVIHKGITKQIFKNSKKEYESRLVGNIKAVNKGVYMYVKSSDY